MTNEKFAMLETKIHEPKLEIIEHGLLTAGEEWNYTRIVSPYNRLYFILDGEGFIDNGKQHIRLQKGHTYLIPVGTCYDYRSVGSLKKLYIHFQLQIIPGIDLFCNCTNAIETDSLREETRLLIEALRHDGLDTVFEIKSILSSVFASFLRIAEQAGNVNINYSGFKKQQRVLTYLEQNLCASLKVSHIADALREPYYSLSRSFKADTGMNLKEYMEILLLNRARRLLTTTDLKIGEIASELGFSDPYYFTKFFGSHESLSPKEYRKRKMI